jgi:dihydroorotate dehydrogenase (fumarate)
MDLSTTYLGLQLPHPFMPGASPLVDDLDTVKRLEDAGAAAIVMHSLFEEQIAREQVATFLHTESHGYSFAEALTYFPSPGQQQDRTSISAPAPHQASALLR